MSVIIQEGRYYERRDGKVVGPAEPHRDGKYTWRVCGSYYTANGEYLDFASPDLRDLIREVPNPNAPAHSTLIFGAVVPGNEPVPVVEKVERVLWEGRATRFVVLPLQNLPGPVIDKLLDGSRIRIVEIGE